VKEKKQLFSNVNKQNIYEIGKKTEILIFFKKANN
jgi:hypothetical protein